MEGKEIQKENGGRLERDHPLDFIIVCGSLSLPLTLSVQLTENTTLERKGF